MVELYHFCRTVYCQRAVELHVFLDRRRSYVCELAKQMQLLSFHY